MLPVGWRTRSDGPARAECPLAPMTTWRIGGAAELLVEPRSREELSEVLADFWRNGQPWRLLGGGSNLLIGDRGVRGAVVSLARLRDMRVEHTRLFAEAGVQLHALVRHAAQWGLSGAEPLAGIPGHIGGAVFGNAGGKHGAIGPLVLELELVAPDGSRSILTPGPGFFEYRHSLIRDRVVVSATLQLTPSEPAAVQARSSELIAARRASQPGWVGNAGCVFRNPAGQSAGGLIDSAGCKGAREGGIIVSPLHANFFENPEQEGTSADVVRLADRVRNRVAQTHNVDLVWEVGRWNV